MGMNFNKEDLDPSATPIVTPAVGSPVEQKEPSLLTTRVQGKVKFVHYQACQLWYECEDGFRFSVDVPGDTGTGKFLPEDKALYFMRYIRKAMEVTE